MTEKTLSIPSAFNYELLSDELKIDLQETLEHVKNAVSEKSRKEYGSSFRAFEVWCKKENLDALPAHPLAVAAFLTHENRKGLKLRTLQLRLAAISFYHRESNLENPTSHEIVQKALKGIKRQWIKKDEEELRLPKAKEALTIDKLEAMLLCVDASTLTGLRDRALLMLGFAGAFRESELVALRVSDLKFEVQGLKIRIRKSKTDQEGKGKVKPILSGERLFPVDYLRAWLHAAKINESYLFRKVNKGGRTIGVTALSERSVDTIVKKYAALAGLHSEDYAGHSLRSGFTSSAAKLGKKRHKVKSVTGQSSDAAYERYVQDVELFEDHAAEGMY